jgi:hypothetical protein
LFNRHAACTRQQRARYAININFYLIERGES